MNKRFEANIFWVPEDQGGRKSLPFGDKYAPQIYVTTSLDEMTTCHESKEIWSIFVLNKQVVNKNETIAELEYLADTSPDNLFTGTKFELREGNRLVATGIILGEIRHFN